MKVSFFNLSFFVLFAFILLTKATSAQKGFTTVGVQFKPIFESGLLKTGKESIIQNNVDFNITLKSGFAGGMIIRRGLSDLLSLESGINYVKRNYELKITDHDADFTGKSDFSIIGYEIPLSLLVYIQLGEYLYANASLGYCLDMFASDISTSDTAYFQNYAAYNSRFKSALLANLGFEWRTEKSGYFYIGASYHRPFGDIYSEHVLYEANGKKEEIKTGLSGNYLTLDFRYFFYENNQRKRK